MSNKFSKTAGVILGIAILLVTGVMAFNLYNRSGATGNNKSQSDINTTEAAPDHLVFPAQIQDLDLIQKDSGPQARGMISKLHGTAISIKEGYIGEYGGPAGQIIIWISESNSNDDAIKLFDIMDRKIAAAQKSGSSGEAQGPPFTDRRTMKLEGLDVVAVKGMGMENYYYRKDAKVYWIAVKGVDPLKTLDEIIDKL